MLHSITVAQYFIWVCFIFHVMLLTRSCADRFAEVLVQCGKSKVSKNSSFVHNFIEVMEVINDRMLLGDHYAFHHVNSPAPEVYGLAQCYEDLSVMECYNCYSTSRTMLPRCYPSSSGRIYLEGCFLRFDTYNFLMDSVDPVHDKLNCSNKIRNNSFTYARIVEQVIKNVTEIAPTNIGFAALERRRGNVSGYALAECWKTIGFERCKKCLKNAAAKVKTCLPADEGRAINAGCYLRYSSHKFYDNGAGLEFEPYEYSTTIFVLVLAGLALPMLTCFGAYLGYKRLSRKIRKQKKSSLTKVTSKPNLNFEYEVLEKATECFDESNKLGQGGNGSVYKGTMPDGTIIAVKRLFFNSRQWVDQFFNEVHLISGIHHKNIVRLLGCSVEGPDSLLVYEYVPNKSLDQFLFLTNSAQILRWEQRFSIVLGIAEGLAHLHGGREVKIIHRDIKTSNILLDQDLQPKIADFGLIRCVSPDKSHLSTGIAGTLGYLAPEYLVRGQLTEKSDVYAFGVLVIEVASGRKNNVFTQGSSDSILRLVWKHYISNTITQCVDPSLEGRYPHKEASNVLKIGLLCTQSSVELRPSMSQVIQMLKDSDHVIPPPNQPPFLNASVLNSEDSSKSSRTNTLP